jgi:hypothetical protein
MTEQEQLQEWREEAERLKALEPADPTKPSLRVLSGDATYDEMIDLFRTLTGREPTAEAIEETRQEWASLDAGKP